MGSFVWDNHEIVVLGRVQNLLEKSSLFDCTLAAEGQYLNAHKLILASSSPYFELLFSQERERNPIVILKDVKFKELKAIVDFIYYGKTEIPACQVNSFLKTAESLQVFGLIDPTNKNSRQTESAGLALSSEGSNSILCEQKKPGSYIASTCETSLNEDGSVQSEIMPIPSSPKNPVISEICNNVTLSNQSINANIRVRSPSVPQENKHIEINNKQNEISNDLMQCDTGFREASKSVVERQIVKGVLQKNGNSCKSSTDQSKHYSGIITDFEDNVQDNENEIFTPQLILNTDNQSFISSQKSSMKRSKTETVDYSNNQGKIFEADAPLNVSVGLESSGSIQDMNSRPQTESKIYSDESSSMPLDHCVTIKDEPSNFTSDENFDNNECNMDSNEDDRLSWNNSNSCNQLGTNECVVSAHVPGVASSSTYQNFYEHHHQDIISVYGRNNQMPRGTQGNSQNSSLGKKIHTCPYCKKNFQWLSTLEIHVRTHTGEKPYWCSFCDAKFARKDYLKSHVVSHSGEKRYGCLECGKRFTQKHNLKYHEASHTGVKPFECYSCGRSFSQKRSLSNHLLTHVGE